MHDGAIVFLFPLELIMVTSFGRNLMLKQKWNFFIAKHILSHFMTSNNLSHNSYGGKKEDYWSIMCLNIFGNTIWITFSDVNIGLCIMVSNICICMIDQ